MAASQLQVVSATEEISLIVGTYMIGPIGSGITIFLLFALIRFAIRNPQNNNTTQYLLGIFSMLFTVLLNVSYCILGTDLIVPWNDNILLQDDYDSNTMLEFTSLCIFLWYFGKLSFYISFIYYAYSFIALPPKLKLNLKYFMVIQIILTLFSVACLIYLNHNIYQIAITPILSDISCLMILFTIYIQQSHKLQFERYRKRQTTTKFIDLCVRSIMLLFCGSLPTWILFINIFIKSSIIWILLPYDLLINNFVLFLMYSENLYLYKLFCVNCHKTLYYQCFFADNYKYCKMVIEHNKDKVSSIKSLRTLAINQKINGFDYEHCMAVVLDDKNFKFKKHPSLVRRMIHKELDLHIVTGAVKKTYTLKWKEWEPCTLEDGTTGFQCIQSKGAKTCNQIFGTYNDWFNHAIEQKAMPI